MEEMENCKGTQFDPEILDAFMVAMRENKEQIVADLGLDY
jgi:HD-GYP domain-containing protein (c-di-GMP phosphodiesterase class II)